MKAAVIEQFNHLAVKDVPEPVPGEYQALCEMLWASLCSGTDLHILEGNFPWISPLPTILGHETVARVLGVGPKVRYLKPGDLVPRVGTPPVGGYSVTWGGFAEFGIATDWRAAREDGLPADRWGGSRMQHVLPPDTDPAAATMFITWRETLSYANRIGISPGKSVLVLGSGGNGLSFISHAANAGAEPRVMIGAANREAAARQAGATHSIDHRAPDAKGIASTICPEGFDLAIDAVGRQGVADLGLSLLKAGGTLGLYGLDDFGKATVNPERARGTFTVFRGGYDEAETHGQVLQLFQQGRLDASIWLDLARPFPLDQIADAVEATRARTVVKALICIRG